MIVHLFDDEKFVDTTIENFETFAPGSNRYIVFTNSNILKHPKKTENIEIYPNKWYRLDLESIFKNCKLLIIHYLTPLKTYVLKYMPKEIPVIWVAWGGDAYPYFKNFKEYEDQTAKIINKSNFLNFKKTTFYDIYRLLKYGSKPINKEIKSLKKINYLATVLPPEYDIIKKEFKLDASYVEFSYDTRNDMFQENKNISLGESILIGNSATPSNNHIDVFTKIKSTKHQLIIPLNYGDLKYSAKIIAIASKKYRNRFTPITNFMQLDDYQKLVLSCNTMVMHHIRQQGLGNICLAFYVGIRVFLNSKSIAFKYFKSIGFKVFVLEEDVELLGVELNDQEKEINYKLVNYYWGRQRLLEKTINIINLHQELTV